LNHKLQFTKNKLVYTNYNKCKHPHQIISSRKNKTTLYVASIAKLTTCFKSIMKMVENILKSNVDIKDFKWLTVNSL
jgi:hypothetical protein